MAIDVVFGRSRQDLLEEGVGNDVLDDDFRFRTAGGRFANDCHGPPSSRLGTEFLRGDLVAPVAECPFGELHDVPLMDQRDRFRGRCRWRIESPLRPAAAVPSCETGLIPMPVVSGKRIFSNRSEMPREIAP